MKWLTTIFAAAFLLAILAWWLCFSPAAVSATVPNLTKQWHDQVYGLDDDEVVRLIVRPLPLQRATGLLLPGQITGQIMHLVRANGQVQPMSWTSKTGTVASALAHCVDIPHVELQVQPRAASVVVDGDWVVREQTPDRRRMQALAQILDSVTGRKIEVSMNSIYVYCVVVYGNWNRSEKTSGEPEPLCFYPTESKEGRRVTQGEPKDFLRILEDNCRCRFFDETVKPPKISWVDDIPGDVWDASKRRSIFRALESQTSLQFTETRRPIPIWNVRERSPATQPMKKR